MVCVVGLRCNTWRLATPPTEPSAMNCIWMGIRISTVLPQHCALSPTPLSQWLSSVSLPPQSHRCLSSLIPLSEALPASSCMLQSVGPTPLILQLLPFISDLHVPVCVCMCLCVRACVCVCAAVYVFGLGERM